MFCRIIYVIYNIQCNQCTGGSKSTLQITAFYWIHIIAYTLNNQHNLVKIRPICIVIFIFLIGRKTIPKCQSSIYIKYINRFIVKMLDY